MPSTKQSKVVNAPIDSVWKHFSDFHDVSWGAKVLASCEQVGDIAGTEIGAKRILNGAFHETLTEVDASGYSLKYSIDDGPSPVSKNDVSNYIGVIQLSPAAEGGTLVQWDSYWDSDSEDAVEFCHGIYVALLNELADVYS